MSSRTSPQLHLVYFNLFSTITSHFLTIPQSQSLLEIGFTIQGFTMFFNATLVTISSRSSRYQKEMKNGNINQLSCFNFSFFFFSLPSFFGPHLIDSCIFPMGPTSSPVLILDHVISSNQEIVKTFHTRMV